MIMIMIIIFYGWQKAAGIIIDDNEDNADGCWQPGSWMKAARKQAAAARQQAADSKLKAVVLF
jgi:hypothetical protein